MKSTTMSYAIAGDRSTSNDLEHIISMAAALKAGKELVEGKYAGVTVDVALECGVNSRARQAPIYSVEMASETDERLRLALYEFFGEAGTPFFVTGSYDDVNGVLGRYGKRLERKLQGGAFGKHVVDKE